MSHMQQNEIASYPVHIRNDYYTAFKNATYDSDRLKGVEKISKSMCCIPVGEWLSDENISIIINSLNKWYTR